MKFLGIALIIGLCGYFILDFRAQNARKQDRLFTIAQDSKIQLSGNVSGKTLQKIAFGQSLFSDPSFSRDQNLSCASCHQPEKAFSDGLPLSKGQGTLDWTA